MLRVHARATAIAAVCGALAALGAPAAAQQEHHGVPASGAPVALTGRAWCGDIPLRGAIVQLFHGDGPGRHLVATSVADAAGRFDVRTGAGTYMLEIGYPGIEPHRREVTLANAPVRAGDVRLPCGPLGLDTLAVDAERDAVRLRSGATAVDARGSAAAGGSIADFLRTVPGVELDADGRIRIRNSTSVLVMMNGRRIPLTGDALAAFLRQMPAAALERVEAGTAPSARHDADGAAGAVNLVFRDDAARTGMRSVAGSLATEDHYMGSAAAAGRVGGVLDWDAAYSLSGMRPRTDARTSRWSVLPGDLPLRTEEDSRARARHRLHSLMAGAAAAPTPNTSLALRGAYSWMEGAYRNRTAFVYTDEAGNTATSTTGSLLEHEIPAGELGAVARVDRGRVRFSAEARTSFVNEDFRGDYDDEGAGFRYLTVAMVSRQREHVLRSDLAMRVEGIDLDVGQESRFRTLTSAHTATHFGSPVSQDYRDQTHVHAGYVTARGSAGRVRAEAGVRVEADRTRIRLEEAASTRTAVRVFPSVRGEWTDARRALVYRLAYGRRIHRPGPEMLNPFSMGEDDVNAVIGNPALVPEVSDQVELGVERHGARWTLQLTPFLRRTRDPIRPLMATTASGRSTVSLENLTGTRAAGADAAVRARPTDRTVVTLAGSVAHVETTASAFRRGGVYATARLTADFQVAQHTTVQLYAYRRSAQAIEQGEILPAFTSELALTRRFAGDRGRVTLRINDPLRGDRVEFRVADAAFTQESRRRTARPLLSLFASFAVGGAPRADAPARTEDPAQIF